MGSTTSSQLINFASKMTKDCHPKTTLAYSVYAPAGVSPIYKTGARAGLIQERIRRKVPLGLLKAAKKAVVEVGFNIFSHSMDMAPVDTGELANSGRMSIGNTVYAKGTCEVIKDPETQDTIAAQTDVIVVGSRYNDLSGASTDDKGLVNQTSLNLFISFYREPKPDDDNKPENLALWLHEGLNVYGSGKPPEARLPGRGGYFITVPMQIYSQRLPTLTRQYIDAAIKSMDWDRL